MAESVDRPEVVAAVSRRIAGLPGTRWIGVDGKGAAGKSTLAAELAEALPEAVVIHVDDFARPGVTGWERERFTAQVLAPVLAGRPGRYQRWDWPSDTGAEWHEVPVGRPVIVEGVSSTDVRLGLPWDVTVWVEAPYPIRLARAIDRDGESMRETWVSDWMPSEDAYELAQHPQDRVDFIVPGY